jgi:hypothetical protein
MELNVERAANVESRVCWSPNLDCTQQVDPKLNPGGLQADRRGVVHRCRRCFYMQMFDALAHVYPGLVGPLVILDSMQAFFMSWNAEMFSSNPAKARIEIEWLLTDELQETTRG